MTSALETRRGPTLSDGTKLSELINFERREIAMRVLRDPEIYRLELKRIFARSWVGLAHVAEIPNAGDFVTRHIGQDSVIVTRGRDGDVSVLLNACSHRGMEVCWADHGNQPNFKCPYHGWAFDMGGNLLGAPFEKEMYDGWDKSRYGLRKARVGIYRGRIFGNFDASAIALEDWLGDAAYYLDLPYGNTDPEMEVFETPRRFRVHANWKISADNNSGDGYHGITLHRSLTDMGLGPTDALRALDTVKISTEQGHGLYGFPKGIMGPPPATEAEKYSIEGRSFTCMLFPATFGIGGAANHRMPTEDGGSVVIADIGGVVPCGPGTFELWSARMIEKGTPASLKQALRNMAPLLDLGGVDDMESWPSIQRSAQGVIAEEQSMRYNAVAGVNKPKDWPGPGLVYAGISKDDNQWNFWRRWFELMTVDEA